MKKYFQFTRFRKNLKGFSVLVLAIAFKQYRDGYMTVGEIIITDFMIILMCIFETLIIDWVQMWKEKKKKCEKSEND